MMACGQHALMARPLSSTTPSGGGILDSNCV